METIDPSAFLTLEELCTEVTRLGRRHRLVTKDEEFSGRTVRFYVEKELLPSPGRSGPGKKYPYETVWKALFIRLLKSKHGLSLNYLRQTMHDVPVETMRRVVMGEEPLEVQTTPDAEAVKRHAAKGYQVVPLTGVPERGADRGDWQVLVQTEDVRLTVREGLAAPKLKQLKHIAALIRALDEES
jgi:DNA-binding transcriptional MerR regulator